MQIQLINVAHKLPVWVEQACDDYLRRMPPHIRPRVVTIAPPAGRRGGSRGSGREAELILDRIAPGSFSIALDENGAAWSSSDWSRQLERWMLDYPRVNLLIGGADGLASQCLEACQQRVSLGRMTMPHALVKVVVLEQLYRAWSMLQGHPYHRQ